MAAKLSFSGGKRAFFFIQLCLDNICTEFDACITIKLKDLSYTEQSAGLYVCV